jgi:diadenosine tetraphosphate (Ap4A) HIT family hydrolase
MTCCNIFEVFNEKDNLIKEYQFWKLLIRNRNTTLGNCVAITKRHLERFSDITPEEMTELAQVVKDIENSLKKSFSYDKINWLMLMMKDNHTHFHIIPRYQARRNFAGMEWVDTFEPNPLLQRYPEVSSEILQQVKKEVIKNL